MIERRILLKGFLRNKVNFVLNEDLFMSHHYNVYIEKYSKRPIKAYEVDLKNKRQHILSTLGEYLEREHSSMKIHQKSIRLLLRI